MPKLTAQTVRSLKEPGKYGDQHGLILRVTPSGSKQWIWRGTIRGKRRDLGLGGYPYITLKEARTKAFEYRRNARQGGDPTATRSSMPTFEEAAERVIALHAPKWKPGGLSEKHWRSTLETHAHPHLGHKPVNQINSADVMACLAPIWHTKAETARRVRQRIGAIMKWCIAQGFLDTDPTASILAALGNNGTKTEHMKALPHAEVAKALAIIEASGAYRATVLATRFLAVTATRSGEARLACWAEINLGSATWTVPGSRTKTGKPHRVPLSAAALAVLAEARQLENGEGLIFPSKTGRRLSDSTISKLFKENRIGCVPHGLRSSFRDWCGENGVPRELAEQALAHVVRGVEGAYARSDLLERRRDLMEKWGRYLSK